MGDWSELKRLAEVATPGPWGRDGSYVCPARVEGGTTYIESWRAIADSHHLEDVRYIAAANPAAILALIAENERLQGLACAVNSAMHAAGVPVNADPAELADVIHGLQVQVATLQSSPNSWQSGYDKGRSDGTKTRLSELEQERQINGELRAEVEALRKDAERYRWLRQRIAVSQLRVLGVECSNTLDGVDAGIDSSMGKDNPT